MTKDKDKKIKKNKVIDSGILDEDNARIIKIEIPGRGIVKINITFEKEEDKINLTL